MTDHDALIESLCRSATPVRRPLPPAVRAVVAALVSLALGWLAAVSHPDWTDLNGTGDYHGVLELALTALLGIASLVCAFRMSIAGRSPRGLPLVAGCLLAWLAASLGGIIESGVAPGATGDGAWCFGFVLVAGAPMMVAVVIALRRTRALRPARTLAVAGLGVACLSASLLALCHPFAMGLIDYLMHLAAMACIVALMVLLGRHWIRIPPIRH